MKLRRLEISNFRGIKSLDLSLSGTTTVLIGENNAGKTAILDALRFALKDVRSRRGCAFDLYDFHLASPTSEPTSAPPIAIKVTFQEDSAGEWGEDLLGQLSRGRILQSTAGGLGVVIFEVSGRYDPHSKDFVQSWRFLNLADQELQNLPDYAASLVQNAVTYFYLAALRDSARHFDAKGPFWRPFLKDSQLSDEAKAAIETKLKEVNALIVDSHESFQQVIARLEYVKNVVPVGGAGETVSIEPVPGRLFDMLAKAQVSLTADGGAKVPVGRHGEGTQSLAVLLLFNAFLQNWAVGAPFIALEEPEAHLHPSAVRSLWKILECLPGQKLVSTHSGDLLSEVPPGAIVRICGLAGELKPKSLSSAQLQGDLLRKFNYHIRHARGELLFARCWIIAEGETEVTILSEAARALELDFEQHGIRCVQQRSASVDLYLTIAKHLGIGVVGFCDNDKQGTADMVKVKALLRERGHDDCLFVTPQNDMEALLCVQGFCSVYEAFLGDQPRQRITVPKEHQDYPLQVASVLPKEFKTPAAEKVCDKIKKRETAVPDFIRSAIEKAVELSKSFQP